MRIAAPHHCAAILEDLDSAHSSLGSEVGRFFAPRINDSSNLGDAHASQRQIVPWRKTNDATLAWFAFGQ
jgi:hypothetical protein